MKKQALLIIFAVFFGTMTVQAEEKTLDSLSEGIPGFVSDLKPTLLLRPRYESSSVQNNGRRNANAFTLKTAIGLKAGKLFNVEGLGGHIEATNVAAFGRNYDSSSFGTSNKTQYQIVIDPPMTRLTQGYVKYSSSDTEIRAGRTLLTLDDHRHIGSVGWRQMPQTFGAVSVSNKSIKGLSLYGAYLYERMGIKDEFNNSYKSASALFNGSYVVNPAIKVTAYGYLLEDLSDTFGGTVGGKTSLNDVTVSYLGEYAWQTNPSFTDAFNNATTYINANFYRASLGATYKGFILKGDYEVLGSAKSGATKAFTTPYATLHKFNGWTDVMLAQAAGGGNLNGLRDMYVTVGYKCKTLGKFLAIYHDFDQARNSGMNYGSEWDFLYARGITKQLSFLTKAGFYKKGNSGISPSNNTTKFWAQLVYKF